MEEIESVRLRLDFDSNGDTTIEEEIILCSSGDNSPEVGSEDASYEFDVVGSEADSSSSDSPEKNTSSSSHVQATNPTPSDWIVMQSKVAQLETELTVAKRAAKRARIEEEALPNTSPTNEELARRVHNLEQERNKVMEDLLLLKTELKSAEKELHEKTTQYNTEQHDNTKELRRLQAELIQAQSQAKSSTAERDYYASRCEISEEKHKIEMATLKQSCSQYQDTIRELTTKVNSLQSVEQQLFTAKMTIKQMERDRKAYNDDAKLVQLMKAQVSEHGDLSRLNARLLNENKILRETSNNVELLKYQSLTLEEKVARFENMEAELVKLQLENQELKKKLDQWCDSNLVADPVAMQRHVSELQQRDVMNISRVKELETNIKSLIEDKSYLKQEVDTLKTEIAAEKAKIQMMEEVAMRRERRLMFLTKERDGYINVLKSYQVDGSVEQQVKDLQAELVQCQTTSNDIIKQLESELETLKPTGIN